MKAPRPTKSDLLAAVAKLRRSAQRATARGKRLEARVAELEAAAVSERRRLSEAQDRETATSEILRAISNSPTDDQPVFDTIVRNAAVLCGATDAVLMLVDGDGFMSRAHHGLISEVPGTRYPLRGTVSGRAVSEARVVQVKNLAEADDFPAGKQLAQDRDYQTTLAVPLIREGVAIGAISIRRAEVRLFTDKQIALLQTFADQAVIAIENVRLFTEVQEKNRALTEAHARVTEALEQRTATSDILGVISASPTAVLPVFQKIAVSATRLCNAVFTGVFRFDSDLIHLVADDNVGVAGLAAMRDAFPMRPNRGSATARAILTRGPVNIADIETDPDYRQAAMARAVGSRSILSVPMLRKGTPIGAISVTRAEMSPFGAREIALLRTFADQAVIAIENVRLFTELQEKNEALTQAHAQVSEALEQQTATAEVLRVISSSPTDLQPVFDSIVRSAVQLSGARMGGIYRFDGELMHLAGLDGATPDAAELHARRFPRTPDRGFVAGRAILERGVAQMPDALADPEFESKDFARAAGWRSSVSVPMLRDGVPIGAISVARTEIGIFSANVVGLLETFADQAVIAIENVRLFTELQEKNQALTRAHGQVTEALEQQTATSEILRVISSSPTDEQPVFDAIVQSARRLLSGHEAILSRVVGDMLHLAALTATNPHGDHVIREDFPRRMREHPGTHAQAVRERRPVVVADFEADSAIPPSRRDVAVARGIRSMLTVPMLHEGEAIGAIAVSRAKAGPFVNDEVALLQTFAHQAVIAIENVRLFKELEVRNRDLTEALEQQTATSEILRVISSSPTDTQPVVDAIVQSARRLLHSHSAGVFLRVGDEIDLAGYTSTDDGGDAELRSLFPMSIGELTRDNPALARLWTEGDLVHDPDIESDHNLPEGLRRLARARGFRSRLAVPLRREGAVTGILNITRRDPGAFSDDEIALLQTFANQAVIAIENVRLFTELQASNRELTTSLDTQTATSDILRVISRSQTNVQPVFDAILGSAVRLLGAYSGALTRIAGDQIELAALTSTDDAGDAATRAVYPRSLQSEGTSAQAIRDRAPLNIADAQTDPRISEAGHAAARLSGHRSRVVVPMLRHDEAVGTIAVTRREPGGFSDDEIALLQTFADQAVIAIENARLFNELQEKNRALTAAHAQVSEALEQQTATSEILRVISSSPTDVQPVFDAIVRSAVRLCSGFFGFVLRYDGHVVTLAAEHNVPPEGLEDLRRVYPGPLIPEGVAGRALLSGAVVHEHDATSDAAWPGTARLAKAIGYRTIASIPMVRDGQPIGVINVARREQLPFSETEFELLKTFADQAVIAIENVRLFTELQASNRELTTALDTQTATSDILRVISRSQTDVQPVFDAIVASAVRLLRAYTGSLTRIAGDQIELAALTSTDDAADATVRALYPQSLHSEASFAQAMSARAPINIADAQIDPRFPEATHAAARLRGYRSLVAVPLLRHDEAVGAITVTRREPGGFTDDEIALLQTFADQAVIAIENVRLFTELQASNRELTTALDTQTATSDILRVISRSQTDVQPVFDAIVASAVRLLRAYTSVLTRIAGDQIELVALTSTDDAGDAALRAVFPQPLQSERLHAQAIRDRAPINIADAQTDPRWPESVRANARLRGYRSQVVVPMLHHDEAVGAIAVTRREPDGFTDDEIALLQTFADQAVIAIENARLLSELQTRTQDLTRSVDQLTALGEVGQAVSSSLELETVLNTILSRAVQLAGANAGTIWEYDDVTEEFTLRITQNVDDSDLLARRNTKLRKGEGAVGRLAVTHEPIQIPDITLEGAYESRLRDVLVGAGTRALLAVPLLREDRILGGLVMSRRTPGEFPPEVVEVLKTFATQSALAIQNARLFREIEQKSRELETASQHKSEFLASMSHELRTPLNAIIGFSDVLLEKMFGEINEKQTEYMQDILGSGKHLLSLINDILDLSKIEAGRMELDLADFDLPQAIDDALVLMRERASHRGVTVERNVDDRLGEIRADERKVKQVLLNLLSNAVKFTPEGGRIDVRARANDGMAEISVTDTGIGIAPEDQDAVFEEFKQVGSTSRKIEGTGLGLALCRKFVELHGGRIWVKSQPGQGSTFTFTIPGSRVG